MASKLRSFDLEFQPFIDEVKAKAAVIREYAGAATMETVRGKCNSFYNKTTVVYICVGSCWIQTGS